MTIFTAEEQSRIRGMVSSMTGIALPQAEVSRSQGLHVQFSSTKASIAAEDRCALARGYFLLADAVKRGLTELDITQNRHFDSCGIMLDMSRNAVMTVAAVKRVLDKLAMLGMNLLLLYTEDTYTVPEYPYLGYLRGRYSKEELREIDDYAASLDIELMPCIQVLGHMSQFLQWADSAPLRDQPDILQPDLPATCEFIEKAIASLRSCVRSNRIHVGMDEAHGVGLGRYYALHGATDRFELLNRHAGKVCEICARHGFHPIMWSDMYFRIGSRQNAYYDTEAVIPEDIMSRIPDIDQCYWDYYHMDEAFYDHMLTEHEKMGRTVFAGGIWTWSGFLPHVKRTRATMRPALRMCAKHQVNTVFGTMWGDDGAETNYFLAFSQLPIFSEACWQGTDVSEQEIARLGELLTGLPDPAFQTFGEFYPGENDQCTGKCLIWCDPLYPLTEYGFETMENAALRFRKVEQALVPYTGLEECRYAQLCFRVAAMKGELVSRLRERYLAGDRAYLQTVVSDVIPGLLGNYQELMQVHCRLWERDMKRFGWEILALRYGAVTGRLKDVQYELERYLSGSLPSIPELDEAPLCADRRGAQHYRVLVTPNASL
ncbi:MAG: family 20 glycosylhydrolase [Clostridia bacterium]|nr:family 20 glycosylhydrolase [Clostridia bacterium]